LPPELKTVISFTHEGKLSRADRVCREYLRDHPHDIEAMRLLAKYWKRFKYIRRC
jgi:hypothetical protein